MKEYKSWPDLARAVLAGEWDQADHSERQSFLIGLRGHGGEVCQKAAARLDQPPPKKAAKKSAR